MSAAVVLVLEGLPLHDMAPVAGGVADGEEDRLVLSRDSEAPPDPRGTSPPGSARAAGGRATFRPTAGLSRFLMPSILCRSRGCEARNVRGFHAQSKRHALVFRRRARGVSLRRAIHANMRRMGARVLLVAWKGSTATSWVEPLTESGYTVLLEDTTGERAWRTAKERGIDVVIIDGQKKPSHGRQTGHALRDTAKTREIPIIWTNLDQEDSNAVQNEVRPDVTLVAPTDAFGTLAALQALSETVRWHNGELFATPISQPLEPVHTNGVQAHAMELPAPISDELPDPTPTEERVPRLIMWEPSPTVEPAPAKPETSLTLVLEELPRLSPTEPRPVRAPVKAVRTAKKSTPQKSAAKKVVAKPVKKAVKKKPSKPRR